jgi:radical SAM superfamily enzyme with C-terminal helix-hairpin-helix motif
MGLVEEKLLVRRINIRQVMPFEGTPMASVGDKIAKKHKGIFHAYKEKIRKDVDMEMLRRVVPAGVILKDVRMELHDSGVSFGRQIATYPILVGVPGELPLRETIDVKVASHGFRSVTAVPYPLDINNAQAKMIESLPGVGKKRAMSILKDRPYRDAAHFIKAMDDQTMAAKLSEYLIFR